MTRPSDGPSRVALIIPYGELTILPSVVNTAELFATHGYHVDIVALDTNRFLNVPPHRFESDAVRVTYVSPGRLGLLKGIGWMFATPTLSAAALRVCRRGNYRWIFGIDADGLLAASWIGWRLGVPVIYHSLEIELSRGEIRLFLAALRSKRDPFGVLLRRFLKNRLGAVFKKPLERWAHRRAALTIALDPVRAQALLDDNDASSAEVVILPTAPRALTRVPDRHYLHRRFRLDPSRRILLQIGGISDIARSLELAQVVDRWPPDWTLVLHGFGSDPGYVDELRRLADGYRFVLSTDVLSSSELDDLICSADVGLALYRIVDQNYLHMASGKLLNYLKCGLPVIATDLPNLRRILDDNRCGICVADESEIVSAAMRILADRTPWADNAARCFREHYDFAVHFARVLERLDRL